MTIVGALMILTGLALVLIGAIGALRLPDFYTRSHAIGVMDTLGSLFLLGGLILCFGWSRIALKLLLILVLFYVASPTITHALVGAASRSGIKPWQRRDGRD
jgi:monovalent cation/proton antiporter MnhG/PhaG subunit